MKKKFYLTLDTETATLPFADEIAKTATQKKNIAIAKPLVYDIGWVITDRAGNVYKKENFLIQETFFVPQVFKTAYYKDKRPQYMQMLKEGKISVGTWDEVMEILLEDLRHCDLAVAYNAAFDFKKAIPFTERYIRNLYSENYTQWEERQRKLCEEIAKGNNSGKNDSYLEPTFIFRDEEFPIADLWLVACEKLINNQRYKDYCLKNERLTNSGTFFSTSAETTFSYLTENEDFIESHTALDDAEIESHILHKALKKGGVSPTMGAFPFRNLGTTYEYVEKKPKHKKVVIDKIEIYLSQVEKQTSYSAQLENILERLMD